MKILLCIGIISTVIIAGAGVNSYSKQAGPKPIVFKIPQGFPAPHYTFKGNLLTKEGFELGRKLFYDAQLSVDGTVSCATCHEQESAFSTYDHDLSHGVNNHFSTRNAPGLFNLVWLPEFHLDGSIPHIELQPLKPISDSNEMGEDIKNVIEKLKRDKTYAPMFKAAFGSTEINSQKIMKALAQFTCSIVSADSKYDKVQRGKAVFTTQEQEGYAIFKSKCAACHKEPLFTDFSYRNTGIPLNDFLKDYGRMRVTGRKDDSLKFRVPSLRNVMVTFPYTHDGRFYSIDNVLNHYATGIQQSSTLDSLLRNGIVVTKEERKSLKAFLHTLTDSTMITDKRFSRPPYSLNNGIRHR